MSLKYDETVLLTESSGCLETEGVERTFKFTQSDIAQHIDQQSQQKIFDLKLSQPHTARFDRNGQHLLLAGSSGHTSLMEWRKRRILTEFNTGDSCYDACFLHNHSLYAIAQSKGLFIYDHQGLEVHALKHHPQPRHLQYLPYHYLLVSGCQTGRLVYQDTSTGDVVASHKTKAGPCSCLSQDPTSGLIFNGDSRGVVTLWSPSVSEPHVQMFCHMGPVTSMVVDKSGHYLISTGKDFQMAVHDLRTLSLLHSYKITSPCTSLDVSSSGMLAVGLGTKVQVWSNAIESKANSPYLNHKLNTLVKSVEFCPFEDVLGVGSNHGYSSILVPGAGEANIDHNAGNPFETKKQRRENEVRRLLEKIPHEMIVYDKNVSIGKTFCSESRRMKGIVSKQMAAGLRPEKTEKERAEAREKRKTRGRNTALKRFVRKRKNVYDAKRLAAREELDKRVDDKIENEDSGKAYLNRFRKYKKKS
ncbi:hypothetical protein P9112_009050 [Eukaryota sp. TZLM1-RC]